MIEEKIYNISVDKIDISSFNVRKTNPLKDLDELALSIKSLGLLHPVVLLGSFGKPPYKLIAGQRRFLAHKQILKSKTIKSVFTGKIDKNEAMLRSLVENVQRLDLNHADASKVVTQIYKKYDKDERKVQKVTGLSLRKVRDYINIQEQASDKMLEVLKNGKVTIADVKRALKAARGKIKKAEALLDLMQGYKLTRHQKKRIVSVGQNSPNANARSIFEEALQPSIEESIIVSLPEEVRKGLVFASKKLSMDPEEIASEALHDWLLEQGFIK